MNHTVTLFHKRKKGICRVVLHFCLGAEGSTYGISPTEISLKIWKTYLVFLVVWYKSLFLQG